jgi:hypothetical protein
MERAKATPRKVCLARDKKRRLPSLPKMTIAQYEPNKKAAMIALTEFESTPSTRQKAKSAKTPPKRNVPKIVHRFIAI